jgi:hypothetical protein
MAYSLKVTVAGLVPRVGACISSATLYCLFGVRATDPSVYATVLIALTLTALAATLGPAFRATRVNARILLEQ